MPEVTFLVESPEGTGIRDAMLLVAYPNQTYRTGPTDRNGKRSFRLYRTDQEMTVLGATKGYLPLRETVAPGSAETIHLTMQPSESGRSAVLFTSATGYIPGIEGRLNPINDGGRTYVYADNIAVDGGPANPSTFEIGQTLHLIDVCGMETEIRFLLVAARFSLIEYTDPRPWGS